MVTQEEHETTHDLMGLLWETKKQTSLYGEARGHTDLSYHLILHLSSHFTCLFLKKMYIKKKIDWIAF